MNRIISYYKSKEIFNKNEKYVPKMKVFYEKVQKKVKNFG